MSRILDVSSRLGEYMLSGWVLTDEGCDACSVPMLRSPHGQSPERLICAQCQATPDASMSPVAGKQPSNREHRTSSTASASSPTQSRVSTPPTEVSSTLSSPTFAPPSDSYETMRRRAQSDMASAEIGKRMLRGFAMLAEECPNETCYGIPLVRPPTPGGGRDPRKECVACGNTYVFQKDARGLDRLVLLELVGNPVAPASQINTASHPRLVSGSIGSDAIPPTGVNADRSTVPPIEDKDPLSQLAETSSASSTVPILTYSINSLERSLRILASRLASLSSQAPVDHETIGQVATSIERVTNALRTVKHLHYQETSVHA